MKRRIIHPEAERSIPRHGGVTQSLRTSSLWIGSWVIFPQARHRLMPTVPALAFAEDSPQPHSQTADPGRCAFVRSDGRELLYLADKLLVVASPSLGKTRGPLRSGKVVD
jgi:hypothetical protein